MLLFVHIAAVIRAKKLAERINHLVAQNNPNDAVTKKSKNFLHVSYLLSYIRAIKLVPYNLSNPAILTQAIMQSFNPDFTEKAMAEEGKQEEKRKGDTYKLQKSPVNDIPEDVDVENLSSEWIQQQLQQLNVEKAEEIFKDEV